MHLRQNSSGIDLSHVPNAIPSSYTLCWTVRSLEAREETLERVKSLWVEEYLLSLREAKFETMAQNSPTLA